MKEHLRLLGEGALLLEYGPITMVLQSGREGRPDLGPAQRATSFLVEEFEALARVLERARCPLAILRDGDDDPVTLRRMIASVRELDEGDFTAMAAVAGTFSDLAVEAMIRFGADEALANNGGDIAFRLAPTKQHLAVGIVSDLSIGRVSHRLLVERGSPVRGLATSGFGGRSLTRGVASAVTVLAGTSGLADAAATSIANACDCDDPAVERCLAEELDDTTDIRGLTVTKHVPPLSEVSATEALRRGSERAEALCAGGMIEGALLFVAGRLALRRKGPAGTFTVEEL
jgi:hypothetical protein